MPINPYSILPYFKTFCDEGAMQQADHKLITDMSAGQKIDLEETLKLTEYITAASQYYQQHQLLRMQADPPIVASHIWEVLAHNIAMKFHESRNGKAGETNGCTPADNTGKVAFVNGPPATMLAGSGFAEAFIPKPLTDGKGGGRARAKATIVDKKMENIETAIIEWFKANYEYAIKKGKENGITAQQLAGATAPATKDQADAVSKAFNDYFLGSTYSAKPGLPLPEALVPKKDSEYFPSLAPHKDSTLNSETPRAGSAGFCIGPFYRTVNLEPDNGECIVQDKEVTQKSPRFKIADVPNDSTEFFIDNETNNKEGGRLRTELSANWSKFNTNRGDDFTNLPVNGGKEIEIAYVDANGVNQTVKTGVIGLNTNGKQVRGAAAKNPNYNKPMTAEDQAATGYGMPDMDSGTPIGMWKKLNGDNVLGVRFVGENKGEKWGSSSSNKKYNSGEKESPVASYMSNARVAMSSAAPDNGETGLSYADPRTWGPWTEYTREDDKEGRYKHLIPDPSSLSRAIHSDDDVSKNNVAGVAINGASALPALNKSYWGFRLKEVFDEANGPPFEQAQKAGSQAMPDSAGVILENLKGCAGPVPPLKINEKDSKCTFEWSNATVLVEAGKVGRDHGTVFKRTDTNHSSNHVMYHTIAAHFMDNSSGVAAQIDKKVKGVLQGGMIYMDVTKQIIFPYAPPPLKPFMPNTKKYDW